jgi:hypothetical protein
MSEDLDNSSSHPQLTFTLQPFNNQVGGHAQFLRFTEKTICKPMEDNEKEFYTLLPSLLKSFTPHYLGVVNVKFSPSSSPEVIFDKCGSNALISKDNSSLQFDLEDGQSIKEQAIISSSPQTQSNYINPWTIQLSKRVSGIKHCDDIHQYLLLQDLTCDLKFPCILDLKMGTRQYGVGATEKKIKSQIHKAALSTTLNLGVRLCGMQVYKPDEGEGKFYFLDKYYGRTIDEQQFKASLVAFIDTGKSKRFDDLPILLSRLRTLYEIINSLKGYRFFASSLLLLYDGSGIPGIDVRMVDFAHCVAPNMDVEKSENFQGPDDGYLLGLRNLIERLQEIYNESLAPLSPSNVVFSGVIESSDIYSGGFDSARERFRRPSSRDGKSEFKGE